MSHQRKEHQRLVDDEQRLTAYQRQFSAGPVGLWVTVLGGGFEMTHGSTIEFYADGSGHVRWWGGPDEDPSGEYPFSWRSIGDSRIALRTDETPDEQIVEYTIFTRRGDHDLTEYCIRQTNWQRPAHFPVDEPGFWHSVYPLVLSRPAVPAKPRPWWRHLLGLD